MSYKRYWVALAIVIIGSFAVLGGVGRGMISEAPPIPDVYNTDGQLLFTGSSITDRQGVWQSIGGQEIGTVWGHGAYVAPDWSADWLHRESEILLNTWTVRAGAVNFESLGPDQQAIFKARLIREMRTNIAVAFWNLVGAGLFGFLINPPISLYYVQGLNLTPVHGHTALFGVYGMLGLGLTLFC